MPGYLGSNICIVRHKQEHIYHITLQGASNIEFQTVSSFGNDKRTLRKLQVFELTVTFHVGHFAEGGQECYVTLDHHSFNTVNFNITTDDGNNANTFNLNIASGDADNHDAVNLKEAVDNTVDLNIIVDEALDLNIAASDAVGLTVLKNKPQTFPYEIQERIIYLPCNFSFELFMAQS